MIDPALDTLFLPFSAGRLAWPEQGDILFLRARPGSALQAAPKARLICRQTFLPFAESLSAAGYALDREEEAVPGPFPLILLLPSRQREEARFQLALAVARTGPGGSVAAALANNEGARSIEADLLSLAGNIDTLSKNKCRVFWARIDPAKTDRALLADWLGLGTPRRIADPRFLSRPGLFAWDRIDAGSALLAQHLPPDLAGYGADLGAGFGYLSAEVLAHCPGVTALDLYEAERDALTLAERNLAPLAGHVAIDGLWHDVTRGLRRTYDFIVSNPPFHTGKADRTDLGQAFIIAGAKALHPGGRMLLVANQHLPYEATLAAHLPTHRILAIQDGYKIIEAVKAS